MLFNVFFHQELRRNDCRLVGSRPRAVQFYPMNVRDRAKRVLAGIEAA